MNGGADIMDEAGQSELFGTSGATNGLLPLDEQRRTASLGHRDRGGQAVRAGAHHNRIVLVAQSCQEEAPAE